MNTANRRYDAQRSSRGLKIGLIVVVVVAFVLAGTLIGTIWLSGSPGGGLQQNETSFSTLTSEEEATSNQYTITLDVSATPGASLSESTVSADLGTQVGYLPYATQDGMRFVGWYTAPEGDASAVKIDNNSLELLAPDTNQTLYARFEPRPTSIDYDNGGLPILMYHYFYDPNLGEAGEDTNWMDIHLFESHLAYLQSQNYYFPTWEEVGAYIRGEILLPKPSIMLCSDDGHESFFRLAAPLVFQYGARMTSFIVLKDLEASGRLGQFDENTIFIQSHSYDMHRGGSDGDARILTASYQEIFDDAKMAETLLGNELAYCYPFGKTNTNAKQALADAGVGVALVIENDRAYPLCDPMEVPRLRMSDGSTADYLASVAY